MFLDIGVGILLAVYASLLHPDYDLSVLVAVSVFFSLLPDLDFIYYKLDKRKRFEKGYAHRNLFHLPLLYLSFGTLIIWVLFGNVWGMLFLAASLMHFVHDSIAYGRGVKWLYPFLDNGYAFIYLYSRVEKNGLWSPIFIFNEKSIPKFDDEHGDENWIENIFYKFHPIAIVELAVFLISLIVLITYVR